jgi:hypothetical protein
MTTTRKVPKELTLHREAECWRLRCQGLNQYEIASKLGISQPRVCQFLKRISARTLKDLTKDVVRVKVEQHARLDWVISEAGKQWENEKNPQLLAQFRGALADQRSLWGLDAPAKIAPTTPEGGPLFPGLEDAIKKVYGDSHGNSSSGDGNGQGVDHGAREPGVDPLPEGGP